MLLTASKGSFDSKHRSNLYVINILYCHLKRCNNTFFGVHPIFGVTQAGGYRGGWRLDVRIMNV